VTTHAWPNLLGSRIQDNGLDVGKDRGIVHRLDTGLDDHSLRMLADEGERRQAQSLLQCVNKSMATEAEHQQPQTLVALTVTARSTVRSADRIGDSFDDSLHPTAIADRLRQQLAQTRYIVLRERLYELLGAALCPRDCSELEHRARKLRRGISC
jgi:hypothetical protein